MKLVVHGLIDKRAEIVGKIEALQAQLAQHMADLDSLERSIRIFEPDIDLSDAPVKPVPPPNAAFRGEVQRFLLDTIRKSDVALTTLDLARLVMEVRGLNTSDKALRKLIATRTGHSLKKLRDKGFVCSEKAAAGGLLRWQLTGKPGEPTGEWRNGSG
ncbi:hypothetical protein J3E64_000320 [Sphingobium sp. OAS761]|uniref:hypothetical protein n=1 Tax=Sphingobium sp. OAS761 TaxID=2817901 RepID=UPI00209D0E78|nr:hypothetical protein [Sphingobium sp. OAS761]MCP1468653.1 hypothetical protein [Sphingobium sp. OAS761]